VPYFIRSSLYPAIRQQRPYASNYCNDDVIKEENPIETQKNDRTYPARVEDNDRPEMTCSRFEDLKIFRYVCGDVMQPCNMFCKYDSLLSQDSGHNRAFLYAKDSIAGQRQVS
jgi:hypothetical protein